jgi:hypothetical protein
MFVIVAAIFSTVTNLSMTVTLPDRYDNYADCLYWATTYKASVNDQEGPVRVREVQCRPG